MKPIIGFDRSIIVAADVQSLQKLFLLAEAAKGIQEISAFKLGFTMAMHCGLSAAVATVRNVLGYQFPIIYDHQKAGTDVPDTGPAFAESLRNAGVDVAILFPFAGPETQTAWTRACVVAGLQVMTGGVMTHSRFLRSEGGYIADGAVEDIYRLACQLGVRDFVVPGTKIDWVTRIRGILEEELGERQFSLYAPGFVTQGGEISECGLAAGNRWHAIVGRGIYGKKTPEEMRAAAIALARQITTGA